MRPREDLERGGREGCPEEVGHKRCPCGRRAGKPLDPLGMQGPDLVPDGNNVKTASGSGLNHHGTGDSVWFRLPEETEDELIQLKHDPRWHVDKGGPVPDTCQGQGADDKRPTPQGEVALAPRPQDVFHG